MVEPSKLSRREREILAAVVRLGRATVGEVRDAMEDAPSYSAVRTTMGILVDKGHLRHRAEGRRYVYRPVESPSRLRRRAVLDVVRDYFDNSAEQLVDALLDASSRNLDAVELDRIAELVERARNRKR